jgi:hypothetical protein
MKFKSNLSCASLLLVLTGVVAPNLILSKPAVAVTQSVWRSFSPPGSGFSVLMPGTPKEEIKTDSSWTINGKKVNIIEHTYVSERIDPDGTIYTVSYIDYPAISLSSSSLEEQEEQTKKLLEFLSALLESNHPGIMQRKQVMRLNGHLGTEMKFGITEKGQSATVWMRAFAVPRPNNQVRTYYITVFSTKEQSLQRTLNGFFNSFKLIDP